MQHFPKLLSSQIAFDIARVILDGFDKHYSLFRQASQAARDHFERMTWKEAQAGARERIAFYDSRVDECVQLLKMNTKKQSSQILCGVK
jgi:isocitrate dehydrogenase kinase/phosphatase